MSDHIPFEIQSEIIKRVHPVKSLIRFRSVCKQWKSLIDSPEFITHHLLNNSNTQSHHLLIRELPSKLLVVWNPFIRKSVAIGLPVGAHTAGFGVCPNTTDIKTGSTAEVFTLSTRIWRRIPMNLLKSVIFAYDQVVVDGVVHWLACDPNKEVHRKMIITFDFASEEFGQVALPDRLVGVGRVDILRFKDSLAAMDYREDDARKLVCDVWVMLKNGVTKSSSFTKLFTVQHNSFGLNVIGFRKNGQPIVKLNDGFKKKELQVYEWSWDSWFVF